jgi:hypothetical protein
MRSCGSVRNADAAGVTGPDLARSVQQSSPIWRRSHVSVLSASGTRVQAGSPVSSLAQQQGAGQLLLAQGCARSTHRRMECTQCIADGRVVHKVHRPSLRAAAWLRPTQLARSAVASTVGGGPLWSIAAGSRRVHWTSCRTQTSSPGQDLPAIDTT